MRKAKEFKVVKNRLQFRCPVCGTRKNTAILNVRRKTIRCHQCGEMTRCVFNRRVDQRDFQSGKVTLRTRSGHEVEVNLRDISASGVGFELRLGTSARLLSVGQEITLRCNWNPRLLPHSKFVVQTIRGQRVGVKLAHR